MEKVVFIIAASALCAVPPLAEVRYIFVNKEKNWTEAQSYCREKYSDLATVSSMEDVQILNNMAELQKKKSWIGLHYDNNSWNWSMWSQDFYQHDEAAFRNWVSGEPNVLWFIPACVLMGASGEWDDATGDGSFKPVCSDIKGQNASFIHINQEMTWTEAQRYCREHHTDLASVRNMAENQKIREMIPAGEQVWIGLIRNCWKSSDGSKSTFSYWNTGEPQKGEDCVFALMQASGKWANLYCKRRETFICYQALCAVPPLAEGRYIFVNEEKTWTEAQSYCREKYSDLATVSSMEDVEILNNMAELKEKVVWIGLHHDSSIWTWSMQNEGFYQQDESEFRNWSPNEPNDPMFGEPCVRFTDSGIWNDVPCTKNFKPICSDVIGQNASFIHINQEMTWPEAQRYCREHHTDLASVRNMAENQKIKEMIPAGEKVWIGLINNWWKWSNGSKSIFRYWNTGEPDSHEKEKCVAADFQVSGKWGNSECHRQIPFICYQAPAVKQVVKLKLGSSSSLDLNDPAVLEDLLKKLRQKLKEAGVDGDVKLSWRKQADGNVFHKDDEEEQK